MKLISLREIFIFTHNRIKARIPDIKPLHFITYDEDDPRICAFEDGETITIAIGRVLEFYNTAVTSAQIAAQCTSLLAHEIIGHDMEYGVIIPPARIVLEQSVCDDENVPYHVQFAIAGHSECMKKVKECNNLCLIYIVRCLLKVRDEVTRYLNERNPRKQWVRQIA